MANNHSQGTVSPLLPLTEAQQDLLRWDPDDAAIDFDDGTVLDPENTEQLALDRKAIALGLTYEYRDGRLDFEPQGGKFYLFCEYGLSEDGATLLQHILTGLDEEEYPYLWVEGAFTCDKLRQGEHGGWACFILRDDIRWGGTQSWIRDQEDSLKAETPGHWEEDPTNPSKDWQYEVANGDTRLGYHAWCENQKQLKLSEGADDGLDG